jgi:hypothetical protein
MVLAWARYDPAQTPHTLPQAKSSVTTLISRILLLFFLELAKTNYRSHLDLAFSLEMSFMLHFTSHTFPIVAVLALARNNFEKCQGCPGFTRNYLSRERR